MPSPTARPPRPSPDATLTPAPLPPVEAFGQPPPVSLEIGGQAQPGGLGTYCWTEPDRGGLCVDTQGVPTATQPLTTSSPFTARFRFDPDLPPTTASLKVFQALPSRSLEGEGEQVWWEFGSGPTFELTPGLQAELDLDLVPDLYVFRLFLTWEARGDAAYGFLVQVD